MVPCTNVISAFNRVLYLGMMHNPREVGKSSMLRLVLHLGGKAVSQDFAAASSGIALRRRTRWEPVELEANIHIPFHAPEPR